LRGEGRGEGEKGEEFLTATPTLILPPQGGGAERKHPHLNTHHPKEKDY